MTRTNKFLMTRLIAALAVIVLFAGVGSVFLIKDRQAEAANSFINDFTVALDSESRIKAEFTFKTARTDAPHTVSIKSGTNWIVLNSNPGSNILALKTFNYTLTSSQQAELTRGQSYIFRLDTIATASYPTPEYLEYTFYYPSIGPVHVVSFNNTFGSGVSEKAFAQNEMFSVADPVRTGYTFMGWYTDGILSNLYIPGIVTSSFDLYAKWEIKKVTVYFSLNGGAGAASKEYNYGQFLDIPDPTRTNYIFGGWYKDSALTNAYTTEQITTSFTLYARWLTTSYTVTFVLNGGTGEQSKAFAYGDMFIVSNPTRDQYDFGGWYTDSALTQSYSSGIITNSFVLYAKWVKKTVTVYLMNNGGDGAASAVIDYGQPYAGLPPTRERYTFAGWYTNLSLTTPYGNTAIYTDTTLYAKWQIHSYTIFFTLNGGTGQSQAKFDYNEMFIVPDPERNGYDFAGWYTNSGLTTVYTPGPVVESMTLYAKWDKKTVTIYFSLNGGIGDAQAVVDYGQAYVAAPPVRDHYTFMGWYKDIGLTNPYNSEPMLSNMTLYAKWQIEQYTINLELNGGSGLTSIKIDYNQLFSVAAPSKPDFIFDGWYTSAALTTPYVPAPVTAAFTLYAKWKQAAFTVTFILNGGTGSAGQGFDNGMIFSATDPVRTGYTFMGWYTSDSLSIPYVPSPVLQNFTLYAKWQIKTYVITIMRGAETYKSYTVNYGVTLTQLISEHPELKDIALYSDAGKLNKVTTAVFTEQTTLYIAEETTIEDEPADIWKSITDFFKGTGGGVIGGVLGFGLIAIAVYVVIRVVKKATK